MLFRSKKSRNNSLTIEVYLSFALFLPIISNLLKYLWVASRIISLSGDIDINPGPKSNALNRVFFDMSLKFKQHIITYVYKSLPSISIHFYTEI